MQNDPNEALLSKSQTKAGRLQRAVLGLLHDHRDRGELPTSNRFLFYELVQRILDKTKTRQKGRGADQDLSDASKRLRDAGLVPWGWIVDETRSLDSWVFADTVAEYLKNEVDTARIDCWAGEPPPLLICESRTFGGVLRRGLAAEYLCPVTATNGQVGGFPAHERRPDPRGERSARPLHRRPRPSRRPDRREHPARTGTGSG
jgi:hypothetical protein